MVEWVLAFSSECQFWDSTLGNNKPKNLDDVGDSLLFLLTCPSPWLNSFGRQASGASLTRNGERI